MITMLGSIRTNSCLFAGSEQREKKKENKTKPRKMNKYKKILIYLQLQTGTTAARGEVSGLGNQSVQSNFRIQCFPR